jgi:two-component system, NtrC family, sensor kinase
MNQNNDIVAIQEKIDRLNQTAWDIRVDDSRQCFKLSEEAVALSRQINYKKGLAFAVQSLGFCYIRLSKNDIALPLIQESLSLFEELGNPLGQSIAHEYHALIKRNWGDFGGALKLLYKALEFVEPTCALENIGTINYQLGVTYKYLGKFEKALEFLDASISLYEQLGKKYYTSYPINIIGSIYFENGDYPRALECYTKALNMREGAGDKWGQAGSLDNVGFTYLKLKEYQLALDYCTRSLEISRSTDDKRSQANALLHLAQISKESGEIDKAINFSNDSLQIRKSSGDKRGETEILLFLAELHTANNNDNADKIGDWLVTALKIAEQMDSKDLVSKTRYALHEYYLNRGELVEAISQLRSHLELEKHLYKNNIDQKVTNLEISRRAEEARKETENIRQRNNELVALNNAIASEKQRAETALSELKATQAQLIQSEKMASLGELTAGIAHEIQNPLNFVNNFSDLSSELVDEMLEELTAGNFKEANNIAANIKDNLSMILHHGKRADSIVKGMLQHSGTSSGQKEATDLNKLADEFLRLAFHGVRAKDKSCNATIKTDFDSSLSKVDLIPQDMGRVLINLLNNAFYSVNEKRKLSNSSFEPTVTVTTKNKGDNIELRVIDNGNGISKASLEKIFQPFFTTKPTGQGTGLGLSLSYDIIKAHGGELKVETKEGDGTAFIIILPKD